MRWFININALTFVLDPSREQTPAIYGLLLTLHHKLTELSDSVIARKLPQTTPRQAARSLSETPQEGRLFAAMESVARNLQEAGGRLPSSSSLEQHLHVFYVA
jgi:hypothetical protein